MCVFFKMYFWCFGYAEVLSQLHRAETVDDFWESICSVKKVFFVLFLLIFVVSICGWNFAKIGIEIKFLSKEKPSAKSYVSANGLVS